MAHTPINGYRELSDFELRSINEIKDAEAELGQLWRSVGNQLAVNPRWMSIAKTHFEEGFSAFVRAIAKPEERF